MKSYKSNLNDIIDRLIIDVNSTFMNLLAASTMYGLGQETLSQIDNQVSISPKVGTNLHIEPIPIVDIKKFRDDYPYFLSEVFHGKLVQLWDNCLHDVFSLFIDLHFTGKRNFEELGKLSIRLDFRSSENFYSHIQNRIIHAFDFQKYRDREKLINKILNLNAVGRDELAAIHKNVLIRNAIQHRNGVIDSFTLKELGSSQIKIFDTNEKLLKVYKENDKILLSIPEIYSFKSSLLYIGQIWRVNDD